MAVVHLVVFIPVSLYQTYHSDDDEETEDIIIPERWVIYCHGAFLALALFCMISRPFTFVESWCEAVARGEAVYEKIFHPKQANIFDYLDLDEEEKIIRRKPKNKELRSVKQVRQCKWLILGLEFVVGIIIMILRETSRLFISDFMLILVVVTLNIFMLALYLGAYPWISDLSSEFEHIFKAQIYEIIICTIICFSFTILHWADPATNTRYELYIGTIYCALLVFEIYYIRTSIVGAKLDLQPLYNKIGKKRAIAASDRAHVSVPLSAGDIMLLLLSTPRGCAAFLGHLENEWSSEYLLFMVCCFDI